MVDNIRRHDKDIPIYIVNTIYWGDQEKIGTMVRQDGTAFLQGEFKNRSDKRIDVYKRQGLSDAFFLLDHSAASAAPSFQRPGHAV